MTDRIRFGLSLLLSAGWLAAGALLPGSVVLRLAPVALVVLLVGLRDLPREILLPSPRDLLVGALAGLLMVGVTYPAYAFVSGLLPGVMLETAALGAKAQMTIAWLEVPALVLIVAAEEILWRGLLPRALRSRLPWVQTGVVATLVYAGAQAGSGSGLLVIVAGACGATWFALRAWTDNLWAPFICHLLWTATVVVIRPLA